MESINEMDAQVQALEDKTLLVLDDDAPFRGRLARALTQRGFTVSAVATVAEAKEVAKLNPPAFRGPGLAPGRWFRSGSG